MGQMNINKIGDPHQGRLNLPIFINPTDSNDRKKLNQFLKKLPKKHIIDNLLEQFKELFFIRNPHVQIGQENQSIFNAFVKELLKNSKINFFGIWVYYPWNNYLVHFLPEDLHLELRTARNRNLITKTEQQRYYNSTVGIAGLSIGNSIVGTLLHTGGPKYMRLADYDILSASNTNRIRTSFINLGLKKTEIAQREIYEVNPYAKLVVYDDGLRLDLLERFLCYPGKLDILVEEMDNIYLKIQIRLLARKYRIPVVMAADNGDNVTLDVERYDQDPNYPLFHGDVSESELLDITPETPKPVAAKLITRWVHPENVAMRMQQSLLELGKTLSSWPQLGTAAFLSGCCVSFAYRNLILDHELPSGKYQVSLDNSILKINLNKKYKKQYALHTKYFRNMLHL
jgi:hypothetical protein